MKKSILLAALSWLFLAAILYLAGAFIAADWDIRTWETPGRVTLAFLWFVGSVASSVALAQR